MATGQAADFVIYEDQFFGGMFETLQQNADVFNAASRNALRLVPVAHRGNYQQESFTKNISGMVSRRDTTSLAAATDLPVQQGELVRPKVMRKIGPVAQTLDSFRKVGMGSSAETLSFLVGQQVGAEISVDYVASVVRSVEAALSGNANLNVPNTAANIVHTDLVDALALFGDKASRIVAWVMHSKPFFDLMKVSITDKITNVADVVIFQGDVGTLNRPVIITDEPALITTGAPDTYHTLGLVADAATVMESESRQIVSDLITGSEQLFVRIQGEYAFSLGVKGFAWDITNGGPNPNDAALDTSTNWDQVAAFDKLCAGVRLTTQ